MTTSAAAVASAAENLHHEFLSFRLGDEEYGIDILKVQEIRGYDTVTRLANTPDFIKGVIDLRGTIVPIIDMRVKFKLPRAEYDQFTVVIILNVASRTIGMVVDGVSDVITLGANDIRAIPELGSAIDTRYLYGVGTLGERMILLLDIERLMTSGEMALLSDAASFDSTDVRGEHHDQ
jgi:purine-binding chemotaxis protein CheW